MQLKVLYIDDDERDLERYSRIIQRSGVTGCQFEFELCKSASLAEQQDSLVNEAYDLIIADFDFSKVDENNNVLSMNGITLSNLLRQRFSECPIVLMTRPDVFDFGTYRNSGIQDATACLDETVYKYDLESETSAGKIVTLLRSLSQGYKTLRSCETRNWDALYNALDAPESSHDDLKLSYPTDQLMKGATWPIFTTAKWVRNVLMKYPGLIYDEIHAATYLGISVDSFRRADVQEFFSLARYSGVFSQEKALWWKSRITDLATADMTEDEAFLSLRKGFPLYWNRTRNVRLDLALCNTSGNTPADYVCCICNKPVMIKYSIRYYPDNRPSVMDEARVSFKAIQTSNDVDFSLFDSSGLEIIKEKGLNKRLFEGE